MTAYDLGEIVDRVPWAAVREHMLEVGWQWLVCGEYRTPTVERLRAAAASCAFQVCGGFGALETIQHWRAKRQAQVSRGGVYARLIFGDRFDGLDASRPQLVVGFNGREQRKLGFDAPTWMVMQTLCPTGVSDAVGVQCVWCTLALIEVVPARPVHVLDCSAACGGVYTCARCERECGWCFGAHDETPALCDDCALVVQRDDEN